MHQAQYFLYVLSHASLQTVFTLLLNHYSTVQSLPSSLKNMALQAVIIFRLEDVSREAKQPWFWLWVFATLIDHYSFSLFFPNCSAYVILPADSREPLETFHLRSKQYFGDKKQGWECSCMKLYLI